MKNIIITIPVHHDSVDVKIKKNKKKKKKLKAL